MDYSQLSEKRSSIIGRKRNRVTITCSGESYPVKINNISSEDLQECFHLPKPPKFLLNEETNEIIHSRDWEEMLIEGRTYHIKEQGTNFGKDNVGEKKSVQKNGTSNNFRVTVLHSLIASTAVYKVEHEEHDEESVKQYLYEQAENHFFEYIIPSKHGKNIYLIAKEKEANRIYVAFRGTKGLLDWECNLQVAQETCQSSSIKGKFHSGFLKRAETFQLDEILCENEFKDMDVVVCGHSLGGAIASIVAIKLFISLKRFFQKRSVKCITFGAPLIGDRDLRKNVPEEMLRCIHHFVSVNDPVLNLLRYTQSVLPLLQYIKKRLPISLSNVQGPEGTSSNESTRNKIMEIIESYSSVIETIDRVMPVVDTSVRVASFFCPAVKKFQNLLGFIGDVTTAIKCNRDVYTPIGNFYFLSENINDKNFFSWDRLDELEEYINVENRQNDDKVNLDAHMLSHYTEIFIKNGNLPFHEFPSAIKQQHPVTCEVTNAGRDIQFKYLFNPLIDSVELTRAQKGEKHFLRLSFTGKHIHNIVLDLCQFGFNFPFAKVRQKVKIRKSLTVEEDERLVIEQEMENSDIVIPDCGIKLLLVTQFGKCEKILQSKNVRDVVMESVQQIAENDSVSLVVKRAIQRGMALKKIQTKYGYNNSEKIIDEIVQLGTLAIGEDEMKKKNIEIFTENVKNIDNVFSNEKSFRNVKDFCNKIEEYIRSPLYIQAEWTAFQKIVVGFSAIAGGAIAASIAGPGLVSIGLAEATSTGLVYAGGFAGALTAGATATYLNNDQLTDSNYKNALNFIVQELLKAQNESLSDTLKKETTDLIDEDNFFSNEKALIRLAPKKKLETAIFEKCIISNSTRKSKEEVIKRIKAIHSIHKIRKIFSQQCFIGVVGLQDAGKTTLVNKIWNVGEKAGYFNHTKRPELHQITQKLQVIDFPGSDSLHYYSKTFSICGAMNNMIIAVIPFSGDVSEIHSKAIANIFEVMKGSKSTKVILCINKCGLFLNKLKEELKLQEKPADYLKQDYVKKLNDHYEKEEQPVRLKEADILFTDWELKGNQESVDFGIIGIEEIKNIIKDYLIDYGIYKSSETDELERCVSSVSN